jgi:hypothetical protein
MGKWITDNLAAIRNHFGLQAMERLRATGVTDIGVHIQKANRQAIAHAAQEPVVDPDDPAQSRRLMTEIPIMMCLGELAIENVLGVETPGTVLEKHLYELAGFRKIFGEDIIRLVASGETEGPEPVVDIPEMTVRIYHKDPYLPLTDMNPLEVRLDGTRIAILLESKNRTAHIVLRLDFAQERLIFEVLEDLSGRDDGSVDAAFDLAEVSRFHRDYFANGRLEIYSAVTGELLGRKDPFIPFNMMLDWPAAQAAIDRWKATGEWRRQPITQAPASFMQYSGGLHSSVNVEFKGVQ